ncbi:biliverdin-producing heme oxygenase [Erythrobacter rubeus]|uniref:Biliverdin-producing heme oxygenase n=1 Tax=Erythrobacter rubeus TaxID=2760803 RepID=A0ABR8KWN3_9SPHN|nr:biliverdin-producing heme oxygenase [Erythrobacter rubeus]MBD2842839.1 biliverdin-producing heme oxygenase [Erythrobacter rubeus]
MREASGWEDRESYARFLTLQYRARSPIEAWLAANAPKDMQPPPQCPAIVRDLAALGSQSWAMSRSPCANFLAPEQTGAQATGIAWVLAGSALGNRSILKELGRAGRSDWPTEFLADAAMLGFWSDLKRRMQGVASRRDIDSATQGALAAFDHFLALALASGARGSDLRDHTHACPVSLQ